MVFVYSFFKFQNNTEFICRDHGDHLVKHINGRTGIVSIYRCHIKFKGGGNSYFYWVSDAFSAGDTQAVHYFAGVILLACWAMFVKYTIDSLGSTGTILRDDEK